MSLVLNWHACVILQCKNHISEFQCMTKKYFKYYASNKGLIDAVVRVCAAGLENIYN